MFIFRVFAGIILSTLLAGSPVWGQRAIPVSIFNRGNASAPEFTSRDFTGSFKGKSVHVNSIIPDPGPRRVIILLDISGSMLGSTTDADWNFPLDIAEILLVKMPPNTQIGLAVFATELGHVVALTNDRKKLNQELEVVRKSRWQFGDRNTAIWDAILAGAKMFDSPQVGDALYLITDGFDNKSEHSAQNAVQELFCNGIRLFPFVLADRRKTDHEIRPSSFSAHLKLTDMATDTGGLSATAMRPSSSDFQKWEFVDKSGNPTELTASLFAQYQQILNVYRMSIDIPGGLEKPEAWHLDFDGLGKSARSNLLLLYPQKIASCP